MQTYIQHKTPTTEASPPPQLWLDALLLALGGVHVERLAQDGLVPATHTQVIDTVLHETLGRKLGVAGAEGAARILQDPTVACIAIETPLCSGADCTGLTGTPDILAFRVCVPCSLPAVGKVDVGAQDLPSGRTEVVLWMVVEVATQATGGILVVVGHGNPDIVIGVVRNHQAKVCADRQRETRLVHLDGAVTEGEGSRSKGPVNLEANEGYQRHGQRGRASVTGIYHITSVMF